MIIRPVLVTVLVLLMASIICFKCLETNDDLESFKFHFEKFHPDDLQKSSNFLCKQGNCRVTRTNLKNLIIHIRESHVLLPAKQYSPELGTNSAREKVPSANLGSHVNVVGIASNTKQSSHTHKPQNPLKRAYPLESKQKDSQIRNQNTDSIKKLRESVQNGANKLIADLKVSSKFTSASLGQVAENTEAFLSEISDASKVALTDFLKSKNVDFTPDVENFVNSFRFDHSIGFLKSQKRQEEAVRNAYNLISPVGVPLGNRLERRFNKVRQRVEYVRIYEKFQYVSIIEILKLIISHDVIREHINSEEKSSDGFMHNFRDGLSFALSEFFQKFPKAIRLQIYYDDVVVNNKLGTKVPQHKLGMFYFVIQNLPKYLNSLLGGIHVFGIGYTQDIAKYGFKKVLQPFLSDLRQLESDEGVPVNLSSGEEYILRATLTSVSADGLAAHQLFGLLSPGGALHFCRSCMIGRNDFHKDINCTSILRTKEQHQEQLKILSEQKTVKAFTEKRKEFGVEDDSALHKSRYWYFTKNWQFDPMHDIFEGNGQLTLKLVIHHFITNEKYNFTVDKLNQRINQFEYGPTDIKDKPSDCFTSKHINNLKDHKIRQTAAQTWCLMRIFPFLVSDIVEEGNEHVKLIILLNQITEIILAPKTCDSILPYLNILIRDFNALFKELFPHIDPINKLHHWLHYCDCIRFSGPMRAMACFRFEAKHRDFTKYGSICQNYKNLPLSMINLAQMKQAAIWGGSELPLKAINYSGAKKVKVAQTLSKEKLMSQIGLLASSSVETVTRVELFGSEYLKKSFIVLDNWIKAEENRGTMVFGRILEFVIHQKDTIYILCEEWPVSYLEESLNANVVTKSNTTRLVTLDMLYDHKPLSLWKDYHTDNRYISLRHLIF
ncbi:hypothetical protein QAD02_010227 [Eretmocerus hayati]|uniref:Uncharacterized protein n=1 Tax=Eretmocerus hayati TaxID=131215 RepID=A0ACC2NBZ9_9HYME|nr:hypothetical protein QAD02_010227 [Eretmocerus hayati]